MRDLVLESMLCFNCIYITLNSVIHTICYKEQSKEQPPCMAPGLRGVSYLLSSICIYSICMISMSRPHITPGESVFTTIYNKQLLLKQMYTQ